jgi:lysophospholipase L1-like esterase
MGPKRFLQSFRHARSRHGATAASLALALGSVAAVLVAFELLARAGVFGDEPVNLTPVPREITQPSDIPGLPYRLRPGARGVHRFPRHSRADFAPEQTLTYSINRLGFRGAETTLRKPADSFRVVALGDSFTFGSGVRDADTWPAALGRELGPGSEVLNLGVMAYDSANEVALLEAMGLALDPDLVLVAFHVNDAGGGGQLKALRTRREELELPSWRRASRLLDVIASGLESRSAREAVLASYRQSFAPDAAGWDRVRAALRRLRELADEHGFEVAIALYPLLWDPLDRYVLGDVHATVAAFARDTGLRVVDLAPAFAAEKAPELWIHPANHHPNERANAIAARALGKFLLVEGLVQGGPGGDLR